jgi:mRNA export factor
MSLFGTTPSPTAGGFNSQSSAPDTPVVSPPSDGVSSLNFTPAQNASFIVSTSWSGQVQCWEVGVQGASLASQPKAETKHDLPLDSEWTADGTKILTCGCDRTIKLWDLATNQQTVVGTHDAPVRHVCALDPVHAGGSPVIVTGEFWAAPLVCSACSRLRPQAPLQDNRSSTQYTHAQAHVCVIVC